MNTAETWGRIYAIIDFLTPGGLSGHKINSAAAAPGLEFGSHMALVARKLRKHADIDARIMKLLNELSHDDMQARNDPEQQGKWFLGFYHERARLPSGRPYGSPGRPIKGSAEAVDWSAANWDMSNAEIARALGVSRQAVAARRVKRAEELRAKHSDSPTYNINSAFQFYLEHDKAMPKK